MSPFVLCFSVDIPASIELYTLSLHDALPIYGSSMAGAVTTSDRDATPELINADGPVIGETSTGDIVPIPAHAMRNSTMIFGEPRSEEHTSELQSRFDLVCCLLLV